MPRSPAMHSVSRQARHHGVANHAVRATRSTSTTLRHINRMQAVQHVAADCLRFISAGNICYAWGMVLVQAFNGAGDTKTPSLINFFCYWCFQLPLAYVLAVLLHFGPRGVFAAIPAAETAMTISSLMLFRSGKWKTMRVIEAALPAS